MIAISPVLRRNTCRIWDRYVARKCDGSAKWPDHFGQLGEALAPSPWHIRSTLSCRMARSFYSHHVRTASHVPTGVVVIRLLLVSHHSPQAIDRIAEALQRVSDRCELLCNGLEVASECWPGVGWEGRRHVVAGAHLAQPSD